MRRLCWRQALAGLLTAAWPGAILLCVLHCSLPSHTHHHGQGQAPSPFLCNHMLDDTAEASSPVSPTVLSSLVLVAVWLGASAALGLSLLFLVRLASVALLARPGEAPLSPPPRSRVA